MNRELLGGPLLGERFEPIITPLVGLSRNHSSSTQTEQFLLLPQERYIQVLAFNTGNIVAYLVPFGKDSDNGDDLNKIESVCLATYPSKPRNVINIFDQIQTDNKEESENTKATKKRRKEDEGLIDHVVLVGCNDGTIREFSLLVLLASQYRPEDSQQLGSTNCGSWDLTGPCYGPRRIFKATIEPTMIRHLTAPSCVLARTEYGLLAYALVEHKNNNEEADVEHSNNRGGKKESSNQGAVNLTLLRLILPPYFENSIMAKSEGGMIVLCKRNKKGSDSSSRAKPIGKISCEKKVSGFLADFVSSEPFCLKSVVKDGTQGLLSPNQGHFLQHKNVFIIVGRPTAVHVFSERLADIGIGLRQSKKEPPRVTYRTSGRNLFCSLAISVNNNDIALGHLEGDIIIVSSFLSQVEQYHAALEKYERQVGREEKSNAAVGLMKPYNPFKNAVEARVHWHAHRATTLCYDPNSSPTDPILYSGGEESVLVTWQPSRGTHRPADHLPRLARRGISFIGCSIETEGSRTNDSILVFCEDNTLQLFETHNKRLLWKVQGLAAIRGMAPRNANNPSLALDNPSVAIDPISSSTPSPRIMLNGLPDAPGLVQWYDMAKLRVVTQMEIAPYNRVSGTDPKEELPMPAPSVTHLALSSSGSDMMTIEKVPTENRFVGATEAGNKNGGVEFGFVSTVKFWACNPSGIQCKSSNEPNKPYQLVAAMARPHGAEHKVSAIAMSLDGQFACTVSNDEKAFRLWQKVSGGRSEEEDQDSSGRRLPVWSCQYKVTTPSGYSNHATGRDAVAFSSDSSILAICYGHMLTLWDRCNMTLLTSHHHFDEEEIDSVDFLRNDMILCKSQSGVSIQSPFCTADLVDVSWCWTVLDKLASVFVSCARYVASHDVVAISIYYGPINKSRIVLINATTGEPVRGQDGAIVEHVPGIVCSIAHMQRRKPQSNWRDDEHNESNNCQTPLVLFALTNEGLLVSLKEGSTRRKGLEVESQPTGTVHTSNAPRLPSTIDSSNEPSKKRRRITSRAPPTATTRFRDKNLSMANFGSTLEAGGNAVPLPTSGLPLLGGGFARAFLGRNLSRKRLGSGH